MAQTNIIELNGKRYDAQTGAVLGKSHTPVAFPVSVPAHQGHNVDGFIRPAQHRTAPISKTTPKPAAPQHVRADVTPPKPARHAATNAKPLAAHQPERSKSLMRSSVPQPKFKMKTAIKTQAPTEMMAKSLGTIAPKMSAYRLDPRRSKLAQTVPRSPHIKRFAAGKPETAKLHVVHHPPAVQAAAPRPHTPAPAGHHTDIFEAAIARATSHTQPAHKPPRRTHHRWFKIGAGMAVVLAVGAGTLWFNRTNIQLYLASTHVGFHVSLPGYAPDGYALTGGIAAANGKVTLSFRSGDSAYTLTQQASTWDSATLRASTVALASSTPRTLQAAGRTIYLYGQGNATWVDGGIRYVLDTSNNLTTQEIANLAASM